MPELILREHELQIGDRVTGYRGKNWGPDMAWVDTEWTLTKRDGAYWYYAHPAYGPTTCIGIPNPEIICRVIRGYKRSDLVRLLGVSVE